MFSYIKGELVEVLEDLIIIDSGGFGIEVHVPLTLTGELINRIGKEIKIYTYFRVYEDTMSLYGFNSRRDLDMFKLLISVNGIGPKGALSILSSISPDDLRMAIIADDSKSIAKAQGVGAKTAKRIILDLKDKISVQDIAFDIEREKENYVNNNFISNNAFAIEAIEALVALGYGQTQATKAVREVNMEGLKVEEILKEALKKLTFL